MTRRTGRFEFHCYNENAEFIGMHVEDHHSESAARSAAGREAKKNGGPVDLCHAGDEIWEDRYITTAAPSEYHATGYRTERLVN